MRHNLSKKNNRYARITATIFTLVIIAVAASSMATAPVAEATATTTTEEATATTTTTQPEGIIELSPEPVYQERLIGVSETAINQTHVELVNSGNGTLTLPNTTETISTTSTASLIASLDGTASGKEVITTEDGSESVTATIYAIARFGMEGGRGIIIALLDTDSTGRLAPLDGMILAGQVEIPPAPEEPALITLSEWQSGVPLAPTTTAPEEPALTDTTTTDDATGDTDNATEGAAATIEEEDATGDTDNATEGAATIEEEDQQEGEQETTPLQ